MLTVRSACQRRFVSAFKKRPLQVEEEKPQLDAKQLLPIPLSNGSSLPVRVPAASIKAPSLKVKLEDTVDAAPITLSSRPSQRTVSVDAQSDIPDAAPPAKLQSVASKSKLAALTTGQFAKLPQSLRAAPIIKRASPLRTFFKQFDKQQQLKTAAAAVARALPAPIVKRSTSSLLSRSLTLQTRLVASASRNPS